MILVDTSVWIDYFRAGDAGLSEQLHLGRVLSHTWVIGELALGRLQPGAAELTLIAELPEALIATEQEVLGLIDNAGLGGSGIGYVDAQLLAAAQLTRDAVLWTHDKRLSAVCDRLGIAYHPSHPKGHNA